MLLKRGIVAATFVLAGCNCGGGAGSSDAGADAGADAGHDAGVRDAGPARDAGTDAGPPGVDAGWFPMPGLPAGCIVERAQHPDALLEVAWQPCPGMDHCQELLPDVRVERAFDDVGVHDGVRGYFAVVEAFTPAPAHDARRIVVLASTVGAIGAWRGAVPTDDGVCDVGPEAVSPSSAAFVIATRGTARVPWPHRAYLYHASIDTIGAVTEPVSVLDESVLGGNTSDTSVQHLAVSPTTLAAEVNPAGLVTMVEDGSTATMFGRGVPQSIFVVGRDVFWGDWGDVVLGYHGSAAAGAAPLIELTDSELRGFRSDGTLLTWQQGYGVRHLDGTYDRLELWTSPVAATTAALVPRRVRDDLPGPIPPTVGGGALAIWADQVPPHGVFVYDLSDGRRRVVEFPLGVANVAPIYVSTSELLVAPVDGRVSGPSQRKLWRIDLTGIPYDGG